VWANRYNDVVNQATMLTAKAGGKLMWVMGATEEHCSTCARLHGIVAYRAEWELARVYPQRPPNPVLECGGWRCQCRLEPTSERHTRDAFDKIMRALG
jgi:hypothetical protein